MCQKQLKTRIKELSKLNINGINYLGTLENGKDGAKAVKNALKIEGVSFEADIKAWIKADNLDQLSNDLTFEGQMQVVSDAFNAKQKMEIDAIASRAEYDFKYAVAELQNSKLG